MKKRTLTEGVVDKIYKLLSMGKYNQAKNKFRGNRELQKAVKDVEDARKNMANLLQKYRKKHGMDPYKP